MIEFVCIINVFFVEKFKKFDEFKNLIEYLKNYHNIKKD